MDGGSGTEPCVFQVGCRGYIKLKLVCIETCSYIFLSLYQPLTIVHWISDIAILDSLFYTFYPTVVKNELQFTNLSVIESLT